MNLDPLELEAVMKRILVASAYVTCSQWAGDGDGTTRPFHVRLLVEVVFFLWHTPFIILIYMAIREGKLCVCVCVVRV